MTLFHAHVMQASEVVGQEALAQRDGGGWIGPFAANPPDTQAEKIGIDVTCPRGLFFANDKGDLERKSVRFQSQKRRINNTGQPTGAWQNLGVVDLGQTQNNPVRRSYVYNVAPGRYEVRFRRLDKIDRRARVGHNLNWSGLKAYLNDPAHFGQVTMIAVKMRATAQLSGRSSRLLNAIVQRRIPQWSPGRGWSDPTATANPAWALADLARSSTYGANLPERRLDLNTLSRWAQTCEDAGDTFNGVFDTSLSFHQAAQRIARCGKAAPIQQNGTLSVVRDDRLTVPTAMFTPRNIVKGSCSIRFILPTDQTPDGVEAEYFDKNSWSRETVTVAVGRAAPQNPAKIQLFGVTDPKQARRLAWHSAAETRYRRINISFRTEMEGLIPSFGDLIAVSHPMMVASQGGEIVSWNAQEQIAGLSEDLPEDWNTDDTDWLIALRRPNGTPSGDYPVQRIGEDHVRIQGGIDFPIYTGGQRERTHYALGRGTPFDLKARVIKITPRTNLQVEIAAINDDDRIFSDMPAAYLHTPPG